MNAKAEIKTVTIVTVELTETDLAHLQNDCWDFGEKLRDLLKNHLAVAPAKNGHKPATENAKRGKLIPCPHCSNTFTGPGHLAYHIRRKHPEVADPLPALDEATTL